MPTLHTHIYTKQPCIEKTVSIETQLDELSTAEPSNLWKNGFYTNHPCEVAGDLNLTLMKSEGNSKQEKNKQER